MLLWLPENHSPSSALKTSILAQFPLLKGKVQTRIISLKSKSQKKKEKKNPEKNSVFTTFTAFYQRFNMSKRSAGQMTMDIFCKKARKDTSPAFIEHEDNVPDSIADPSPEISVSQSAPMDIASSSRTVTKAGSFAQLMTCASEGYDSSSKSSASSPSVNTTDISHFVQKKTDYLSTSNISHILHYDWGKAKTIYLPNKSGRRYNPAWQKQFPWLAYSESVSGTYCKLCVAFGFSKFNGEFVTKEFKDWKNALGDKRGALKRHQESDCHKFSVEKAENFLAVTTKEQNDVVSSANVAYKLKVDRNRNAMSSIIDTIMALGQRGIAFRGDWDRVTREENGNFNFFLNWRSTFDTNLKDHLEKSPQNARYLSPQIQNELISCIGDIMRDSLANRINKSKYISILADETTDSATLEQVAICVRYIDKDENGTYKVCEDLLGFVEVERQDATTIASALLHSLTSWGIDVEKIRGQGYDGASVMSGEVSGVRTRVSEQLPLAKYYTHDSNHRLNLVIIATCKNVPDVRNFMQSFQKLTFYLSNSAKRKAIVKNHLKDTNSMRDMLTDTNEIGEDDIQLGIGSRKEGIPTLCDTRWLSRGDSISAFLANFGQLYDALDTIRSESNGQSSHDAESYLRSLEQFKFIYTAVVTQHMLAFIRPLSVALQATSCDLIEVHESAQELIQTVEAFRSGEHTHTKLYTRAVKCASTIGVEPSRPRAVGRQRHRANAPTLSVEDYYKVNIFYPFVDHILAELRERFSEDMKDVLFASYFIPTKLHLLTDQIIETLCQEFAQDLPAPTEVEQEVMRWQEKWKNAPNKPKSLTDTLNLCNEIFFPNIHTMLQLLLTLPVGSVACERSFSKLRRLKTWDRCSMGANRLNGLCLMYVHKDALAELQPIDVLKRWDSSMHRRIALAFDHSKE